MTSDGKVTLGPWKQEGSHIWSPPARANICSASDPYGENREVGYSPVSYRVSKGLEEAYANAELIVAAVNACFQVSPSNPRAVAEAIPEAFALLRTLIEYEGGYEDQQAGALLSRLGIEERKG
jgi:hypothetical protein